jgi:type II secretory pathway pseudopilin PulG
MSLFAREKGTFRRHRDAAGPRPWSWLSRLGYKRDDDSGFSIIESVAAIAVLAIVLVPTIRLVLVGQQASDEQRLQGEAATVATQAIQELQDQVQQGIMPNGSTQSTVKAGNDPFTVRVTFTPTSHGTSTTYCTTAAGGAPGTWIATATVTWPGMNGSAPFVDTTELAPGVAGALDGAAGTIAVPILDAVAGVPLSNAAIPVTVTLTGTWTQGPGTANSQPAVPNGQIAGNPTPDTVDTTSGCAVFLGVDADPGWTYKISISSAANTAGGAAGAELINSSEESYDNPAPIPSIGPYSAQIGEPTLTSGFQVDPAFASIVSFSLPGVLATSSAVPITVDNSGLGGSDTYVFTNVPRGGTMYLFPYASTYTVWAGDQTTSNPAAICGASSCYPGAAAAASVAATEEGSSTVTIPLYSLALQQSGGATATALTATDVLSPGTVYNLTAPLLGASGTGLPLGQYLINSVPAKYIWLTPTGMCASSSQLATPCGSPSNTPVGVT